MCVLKMRFIYCIIQSGSPLYFKYCFIALPLSAYMIDWLMDGLIHWLICKHVYLF